MSLAEYRRKRDFHRTAEPPARRVRRSGQRFVVQKHAASRLHYDFRLELDGVLKSWAVPKGPCLDPSQKRLAVHVEDHPVAYGDFEGTIPEGEYGGGTVLLWDQGHWEPLDDPRQGYRHGRLKFRLHGQKLHGIWTLVRQSEKAPERERQAEPKTWFLIKHRDEFAEKLADADVLEKEPLSVSSGRTIEQVAVDQDRVWSSARDPSSAVGQTDSRGSRAKARTRPRSSQTGSSPKRTKARRAESSKARPTARKRQGAPSLEMLLRTVRLTSPDKVLYPEQAITKLQLVQYYYETAPWILPHLAQRPLVLVRCPEGHRKHCFYQKHPGKGTPEALRQISIREKKQEEPYVVVDDAAGLISLAQIGALEIHVWGSREDKLDRPDRLVFDLDPDPSVTWKRMVESAFQVRQFLEDLGLVSFLKTTGGKGLHLVVPIDRRHDWEEVKAFCQSVAQAIARADPQHYTDNMSKAARVGKIYVDYLRNGRGATAVAPYSTRAKPGAPVSTPIAWDELRRGVRSDTFHVRNLPERLQTLRHDPWEEIGSIRQSLTAAVKKKLRGQG